MEGRLDGLARGWRDSVRDLSYDIEDCIDRFMDRLGSGDTKPKFMKRTARRLKTLWARHDIVTQIKELKARVKEESERRDRYKLDESYYSATRPVAIDPRITAIHEEVKGLVAMDGPMKHVTALLMDESKELKVVPIVGSGGLGKTTLAMEVYRRIGPGGDFQCQACVSVSRTLDLVKLLKDILSQIDKDSFRESQSWETEQLIREIKQILTGKRASITQKPTLLVTKVHFSSTLSMAQWERLQDSIGTGPLLDNDGNLKVMKDILLLSYWDLPHHLKTCLLYLSICPEDYKIKCKELKWKWMAEGFLDRQWGRLDEVAENFINELVNRNMIQPIDIYDDGTVKNFRVHDMVLDLIISLSDGENFATVLNGRICNSFPNKIRRLSMHSSGKEHKGAVWAITETKIHIRSLTVFQPDEPIVPHLVDFHALRVLDLARCYWLENKHVKHIGSSRQLRYLRIGSENITELPGEIGKLQNLETLDLRYCFRLTRLPSTVTLLQKLVRLFVSDYTELPASGFRSLQALEELRYNKTDDPVRFAEEVNELEWFQILKIQAFIGMVPKGLASLENLVKLCIMVQKFDKEGLQVLMGMPSLAHLQLQISDDINEKLTVGSNGFKLLKVFNLEYLVSYFVVVVKPMGVLPLTFAAGAVPALRRLRLRLRPMEAASDFFADLGGEHLSGLAHLQVDICCDKAAPSRVEALESSVEKAINFHPDLKIHVRRTAERYMFKDDKEWEEAVSNFVEARTKK